MPKDMLRWSGLVVIFAAGCFTYFAWKRPVANVSSETLTKSQHPPALPKLLRTLNSVDTVTAPKATPKPGQPFFTDVSSEFGIDFRYYNDQQSGRFFNGETNGGGVGWIDFDLDDWPDLYFTNGCVLLSDQSPHTNRMYRNLNGERFVDVTVQTQTADKHFGHGVAVADFDNDGWPDLFLANFGPNVLYRNNGDGTFSEQRSAILPEEQWSSSAAFGDLDRDGDLDLYVTTYGKADLQNVPVCGTDYRVYCSPEDYPVDEDRCYLNTGTGEFRQVDDSNGFVPMNGHGMGVVIADFDNDRRPDVFVANDKDASLIFRNETQPGQPIRVREMGIEAGVAFDGMGMRMAGMGIACGDVDANGLLDLFVTHYHREPDTFYRNHGKMVFSDDTSVVGLGTATLNLLGFGTEFLDYDNDSWLDLMTVNGHVLGPHHWLEAMEPRLYRNVNAGSFKDVSAIAGPHFQKRFTGRGLATADFDRDGRIDVAVTNNNEPAYLLRNTHEQRGHVLAIELVGTQSPRSATNARIVVHGLEKPIMRELLSGSSYQSASEQRLLIGLGNHSAPVDVEIQWSSGTTSLHSNLVPNRRHLIREGGRMKE